MPTLPETRIADLLVPYLGDATTPPNLLPQLSLYLDLLLRWNARTNLTAIREPEEIVRRHFGESLFAGRHLAPLLPAEATLLDFGSGAGFPGLPIQLLLPAAPRHAGRVPGQEGQLPPRGRPHAGPHNRGLGRPRGGAARPAASSTPSPCAPSTAWSRPSPPPACASLPAAGW